MVLVILVGVMNWGFLVKGHGVFLVGAFDIFRLEFFFDQGELANACHTLVYKKLILLDVVVVIILEIAITDLLRHFIKYLLL